MFGFAAFGQVMFAQGPMAGGGAATVIDMIATTGLPVDLVATTTAAIDLTATYSTSFDTTATEGETVVAYNRDIVAADKMFFDTDRTMRFVLYAGEPTQVQIDAGTAVIQDATGMALIWVLKKTTKSATALISKTSVLGITLTGVFNASPAINTQRIIVTLSDKDTYSPNANPPINIKPGTYFHALKRTDTGAETILCWGTFLLQQAAAWEAT